MTDQAMQKTCTKADCQVAVTGSCPEGHTPLASCPNYREQPAGERDVYDDDHDGSAEETTPVVERVSLSSGDALSSDEVDQFLRWRAATFVTVVGDSHSGKTTLICALYDRFLKGTFGGLGFAGSRTLVAFERRSHHSRVESGRSTPETARTSHLDGLRYFHFALASIGNPTKRTDLLLSDRSGEVYRSARNTASVVATLPEIPQANRIVLLLDGGRVANAIERNGAMQSVRQSLRVFLDNGALGSTSTVQIVTTKVDLIAVNDAQADIVDALSGFRERLASDFAPRLRTLSFHDVAARDPNNAFAPAHGLDALVEDWATVRHLRKPAVRQSLVLHSEFDRLLERTPQEILS